MRIGITIVTKNRVGMFTQTLDSMLQGLPRGGDVRCLVVDAHSTQSNASVAQDRFRQGYPIVHAIRCCSPSFYQSIVHGQDFWKTAPGGFEPEYYIFTGDDYEYRPNWTQRAINWWQGLS